jgi:excisionase family DNA binding protein
VVATGRGGDAPRKGRLEDLEQVRQFVVLTPVPVDGSSGRDVRVGIGAQVDGLQLQRPSGVQVEPEAAYWLAGEAVPVDAPAFVPEPDEHHAGSFAPRSDSLYGVADPDDLLTVREAAELLGFTPITVRTLMDRDGLPALVSGTSRRRTIRFRRSEIEAWVEGNRVQPGELAGWH